MEWEDFKQQDKLKQYTGKEKTNIKCPKCGNFIFKKIDIILTIYPAQYQYECSCGWIGYAYH